MAWVLGIGYHVSEGELQNGDFFCSPGLSGMSPLSYDIF